MPNSFYKLFLTIVVFSLITIACKKSKNNAIVNLSTEESTQFYKSVLADLSANVIVNTYSDLKDKSITFYFSCKTFSNSPTAPNLNACKQNWKDVRSAWEQTEGFLFGPVVINNVDPRIDTWPVNFVRIDSVLNSTTTYDSTYIASLEDGLKGFHPLEYLLFGANGAKNETQFTTREKDLLISLSLNLNYLCVDLYSKWDINQPTSYHNYLSQAGNANNNIYPNLKSAYDQILDAIIIICDEVPNGKIAEPFNTQNPALEESPFAKNSLIDFTNNIKSVQNIYLGTYAYTDGKGLEDVIKQGNLSMDGVIKQKLSAALTSLNNISLPFGLAISQQQTQVQHAITSINDLKIYLETTVKPYVQSQVQ